MAIIYLARFPERPAPPSPTPHHSQARSEHLIDLEVMRLRLGGAGCDYYPRDSSRVGGKSGQATLPLCFVLHHMGFFVRLRLRDARWALTPPFHPYPALSGITPASLSARIRTSDRFLRETWKWCGVALDSAGRYIFCDTFRHPGFASQMPPISRGMLPYGVRTFLWQKQASSQRSPATVAKLTRSNVERQCQFR